VTFAGFDARLGGMTIETLRLVGGHPALDFANTLGQSLDGAPNEHLIDYRAVLTWSRRLDLLTSAEVSALRKAAAARPDQAARTLARARTLRTDIQQLFAARAAGQPAPRRALAQLNRQLADALGHAALAERGDGFEWRWAGARDALDRPLWPVARAAADLLVDPACARVRECAGDDCQWLFLDLSKNGARRWCSMALCGNRTKIRRFRGHAA
jgi:predicted RNA-binding Zn ribbon-like protein